MTISINTIDDLPRAAAEFLRALPEGARIIAFNGDMGAGKTTFIAELARQLGSDDDAGSPTFAIVNDYEVTREPILPSVKIGDSIYHFDFYRIDDPQAALEIGLYDYFDSGHFCFLEWPERIGSLLPEEALTVNISVDETTAERTLTL